MPNSPTLVLCLSLLAAQTGCYHDTTHAVVRSPTDVSVWVPTEGETRLLVPASRTPGTAHVDSVHADPEWGSVVRNEDGSLETSALTTDDTGSNVLVGRDGRINVNDWGTHVALGEPPAHARPLGDRWLFDLDVVSTAKQRCGKRGYCAKYRYPLQLTTPAANVVEVRTQREYDRALGIAAILLGAAPTGAGVALIHDSGNASPVGVGMGVLSLAIGLAMEAGGIATLTLPDTDLR